MGWNLAEFRGEANGALADLSRYYFVHSYYVTPDNSEYVASTTHYGEEFTSGIQHDNIHAFQFHPEKSQALGLVLLKNFSQLK